MEVQNSLHSTVSVIRNLAKIYTKLSKINKTSLFFCWRNMPSFVKIRKFTNAPMITSTCRNSVEHIPKPMPSDYSELVCLKCRFR